MSVVRFKAPLNPLSAENYILDFNDVGFDDSRKAPFLDDGETVADLTLVPTAPSAALGLTIKSGGGYDPFPVVDGGEYRIWVEIDPACRQNSLFQQGVILEILALVKTSSNPPRTPVARFQFLVQA